MACLKKDLSWSNDLPVVETGHWFISRHNVWRGGSYGSLSAMFSRNGFWTWIFNQNAPPVFLAFHQKSSQRGWRSFGYRTDSQILFQVWSCYPAVHGQPSDSRAMAIIETPGNRRRWWPRCPAYWSPCPGQSLMMIVIPTHSAKIGTWIRRTRLGNEALGKP